MMTSYSWYKHSLEACTPLGTHLHDLQQHSSAVSQRMPLYQGTKIYKQFKKYLAMKSSLQLKQIPWIFAWYGERACPLLVSIGALEQGTLVVPFKIMRYGIQSGELLWRSQFWMDFIENWQTCAKNCFLLAALLLKSLLISLRRFSTT